ncbi:MAG TPA: UDP-N-acetylmuramoyl-tripeptide--D-alanyl-D-alanine ligase [Gammaproteobacteria bacterium]|nr:UDP-N-acetylmuramoyl-tripeptide--D-alanyl-D-alanine ligase [Gammaproteobacteria bacterium]
MDTLMLSEIAALLDAPLVGADTRIEAVATDSRSLPAGALFVALRGERFDGHDFIAQALTAGAAAVLVDRPGDWGLPSLLVDDTRLALGRLASAWRQRLPVKLVAVTGSNGKTTVKEMTAAIMRQCGPTLATAGNLNNDIGMPLTLLRLTGEHAYAVVEMGASSLGEIDYLARLARPDVGIINNAGPAHLEGFGSQDAVARGKGEMVQALGPDAAAVINADDAYAPLWREYAAGRRVLDFAIEQPAAISARAIDGSRFILRTPTGEAVVTLPLPGRHNILNALAAAAAAIALGVPLAQIVTGLEAVPSVKGRLTRRAAVAGAWLLDDSYNANPNSLRAGLQVLAGEAGERWLVLGDMAELGPEAEALHAQAGETALALGIHRLFAVGRLAPAAAARFGGRGESFDSKAALLARLMELLEPGVTVLVKGSRSSGMEQVVEALLPAEPVQASQGD